LRAHKELIDTMQRDIYRERVDSKLQDTVRTILKRNVRNVPVVDSDEETLIGLVTRANLVDIVYDSIWGELDEDVSAQKNAIVEPDNVGADK
uniref:CBS domain-containing protein n=1 Tax=Staphylococcus sp. GDY8P100P TaxID=2804429 RepID=UPI00194EBE04